jgi:hypothetical protein
MTVATEGEGAANASLERRCACSEVSWTPLACSLRAPSTSTLLLCSRRSEEPARVRLLARRCNRVGAAARSRETFPAHHLPGSRAAAGRHCALLPCPTSLLPLAPRHATNALGRTPCPSPVSRAQAGRSVEVVPQTEQQIGSTALSSRLRCSWRAHQRWPAALPSAREGSARLARWRSAVYTSDSGRECVALDVYLLRHGRHVALGTASGGALLWAHRYLRQLCLTLAGRFAPVARLQVRVDEWHSQLRFAKERRRRSRPQGRRGSDAQPGGMTAPWRMPAVLSPLWAAATQQAARPQSSELMWGRLLLCGVPVMRALCCVRALAARRAT